MVQVGDQLILEESIDMKSVYQLRGYDGLLALEILSGIWWLWVPVPDQSLFMSTVIHNRLIAIGSAEQAKFRGTICTAVHG